MNEIDCQSVTERPPTWVAGYHIWTDLAFIHWRVPASLLQALVPPELTVDTFDGSAWVGLVPFQMCGVRPWWSPAVPGLCSFPETNVRTYVHHRGRDPGVWFFSLDAARWLACQLARWGWGLNYHWSRMSVQRHDTQIDYRSCRYGSGIASHIALEIGPPLASGSPLHDTRIARPGTLEHFLVERYLLYANRLGRLYQAQVRHRPYPLHSASLLTLEENLLASNNIAVESAPCHVLYCPGVKVEVFGLKRLPSFVEPAVIAAATAST